MTKAALAQPIDPPQPVDPTPPLDEVEVEPSQLTVTEAVSVIFDTLSDRDRQEMKRILKSACALLEFECEFHDETEPEGG